MPSLGNVDCLMTMYNRVSRPKAFFSYILRLKACTVYIHIFLIFNTDILAASNGYAEFGIGAEAADELEFESIGIRRV